MIWSDCMTWYEKTPGVRGRITQPLSDFLLFCSKKILNYNADFLKVAYDIFYAGA